MAIQYSRKEQLALIKRKNINLILFIFILIPFYSISQTQEDRIEILKQEVNKYRKKYKDKPTLVNDSLVVNYKKSIYLQNHLYEYPTALIKNQTISSDEASEIFNSENDSLFTPIGKSSNEWEKEDFTNLKIKLYSSETRVFNNYHVFTISEPVFRKDNKYAIILIITNHEGGVLNFYKKTKNGWEYHKRIQLFYI